MLPPKEYSCVYAWTTLGCVHYNASVWITPLMMCELILYVSGGTYNLKSTSNDKIFENFFIAILFYSQSFCRNLLRASHRRNIFFFFGFDFWLEAQTRALRLISQHTTYLTTTTPNMVLQKPIHPLRDCWWWLVFVRRRRYTYIHT